MKRILSLVLVVMLLAGCHRAVVETGLTPAAGESIDKPFAASWLSGLVPPSTVNAALECPHGVARVVTERSVPNVLVAALTWGIYSPMHVRVDCAAARPA